ncbi:hypothetical protein SI65_10130 [Aspergillus cristatus]|uniref:Uncharacterized protein n=1 Tax=Aspergillus cristatus TaxID=573508 RepID=A0A1E3B0Q5_ASPCR|nr:hypothetical protein SI65_10130 [Aspergillus cristatus]
MSKPNGAAEIIGQFSKLANLEPAIARRLESDYIGLTENVQRYIRELAITFYIVVKSFIGENQWKGIQWIEPPETEEKQDQIVSLYYVDLLRVETRRMARRDEAEKYYEALKQVIPTPPIPPRLSSPLARDAARTFHRGTRRERDVARPLLRAIWKR